MGHGDARVPDPTDIQGSRGREGPIDASIIKSYFVLH